MATNCIKTEHGKFQVSYVLSFKSAKELLEADILNFLPKEKRDAELKQLFKDSKPYRKAEKADTEGEG